MPRAMEQPATWSPQPPRRNRRLVLDPLPRVSSPRADSGRRWRATAGLRWSGNNPNDPSITSYQYRWRAVDDEAWTWWRDIPVNAVLSHILPVLTPVTTYKVQVRALRGGVADGAMEVTAKATSVTATGCAANSGLASDCEVLLWARDELAGGGTFNWSADVPISEWDGVTVAGFPERVTGLRLEGYGLTGTIPSRLGGLTGLTGLWLDDNQLTGSIPAELGLLANLEWLYLTSNRLTGSIPAELGGLSNLRGLHLSSNQLTGTIPSELGGLAGLEWMDLSSNEFGGVIPVEFGGLAKLGVLSLSYNQLGGSIPAELGGLANLKWLYLSSNRLTGSIPSELGSLANLTVLRLNDNQLSGSIPGELGRLINLTVLMLGDNQLSGSIPTELGRLINLTVLGLSNNQLSGTVPAGVGWPHQLDGVVSERQPAERNHAGRSRDAGPTSNGCNSRRRWPGSGSGSRSGSVSCPLGEIAYGLYPDHGGVTGYVGQRYLVDLDDFYRCGVGAGRHRLADRSRAGIGNGLLPVGLVQ